VKSAKGRGRSDTKDYERPPLIARTATDAHALNARTAAATACAALTGNLA